MLILLCTFINKTLIFVAGMCTLAVITKEIKQNAYM